MCRSGERLEVIHPESWLGYYFMVKKVDLK